jgi:hypothetical protein
MRRLTQILTVVFAATLLLIGASCVRAQDAPIDSTPKPAGRGLPLWFPDQDPEGDQSSLTARVPDNLPLTGVQNATMGSPQVLHSYWVPGVEYGNVTASTALNQGAAPGWNSTSYLLGSISVMQAKAHSQLAANYSGGGYFSSDKTEGSGFLHQFELQETMQWQRWQFAILDQFSYLPETAFGFGVGTGIAIPGVGGSLGVPLPSLQDSYQLYQSVFTSAGTRYTNSLTGQAVYRINGRTSVNLAGSYGILRFVEGESINSNDTIFRVGYNYALSRRDTIGIFYRFTEYRYQGTRQTLNDQVVAGAYGRKITGRLAMQLFGGPELTTLGIPIASVNHPIGGLGGATLSYATGVNHLGFTFTHGVTSGSGVFAGASTNQIQAELERPLSRSWHGRFNFGYARNASFAEAGVSSQAFNSSYVGISVAHPINHDADVTAAYAVQFQSSNPSFCSIAAACTTTYVDHRITLGFSWHATPFVLR